MYDTCLENPCNPGEICEETKDGSVFCVTDPKGKININKANSRIVLFSCHQSIERQVRVTN